jgi:anti-sigma B factor antagonist
MPTDGDAFAVHDEPLDERTSVIVVRGEVDARTARLLEARLDQVIADGARRLLVDLVATTFVDSTTLGALVDTARRLERAGGGLALVCATPAVVRVLEITGLNQALPVHPSREEALAALDGP